MSKKSSGGFIAFLAFAVMLISAAVYVVCGTLNLANIKHSGEIINALKLIAMVATFIVIGVVAHAYIEGKTTVWKVIYWVIVVVFIAGVVLGII